MLISFSRGSESKYGGGGGEGGTGGLPPVHEEAEQPKKKKKNITLYFECSHMLAEEENYIFQDWTL